MASHQKTVIIIMLAVNTLFATAATITPNKKLKKPTSSAAEYQRKTIGYHNGCILQCIKGIL